MFVDLLRLCSVPGSREQPVTNTTGVSNQSSTLKEQVTSIQLIQEWFQTLYLYWSDLYQSLSELARLISVLV